MDQRTKEFLTYITPHRRLPSPTYSSGWNEMRTKCKQRAWVKKALKWWTSACTLVISWIRNEKISKLLPWVNLVFSPLPTPTPSEVLTHRAGLTPMINKTRRAMRLCRFQCSTAMATSIPPMKSMLVSFRYSLQTYNRKREEKRVRERSQTVRERTFAEGGSETLLCKLHASNTANNFPLVSLPELDPAFIPGGQRYSLFCEPSLWVTVMQFPPPQHCMLEPSCPCGLTRWETPRHTKTERLTDTHISKSQISYASWIHYVHERE